MTRTPRGKADSVAMLFVDGASENNLAGVSVHVPLDRLVAVVGPSGSGKTSLVHGVVARVARRRWERLAGHLSALSPVYGPRVRTISQLPCVVELRQEPIRGSARSTVATYSGLAHSLANLFAAEGVQRGEDGKPLEPLNARLVADWVQAHHNAQTIDIFKVIVANSMVRATALAPGVEHYAFRESNESWQFLERSELRSRLPTGHSWLAAHVARLRGSDIDPDKLPAGDFLVRVGDQAVLDSTHHRVSLLSALPFQRLSPRLFSTNSTSFGADRCPRCEGLGEVGGLSASSLIRNATAPLLLDGLALPRSGERFLHLGVLDRIIRGVLHSKGYNLNTSWSELDADTQNLLLAGSGAQAVPELKAGEERLSKGKSFPGLLSIVKSKAASPGPASKVFSAFVARGVCPDCGGLGLGPSAKATTWGDLRFSDVATATIERARDLFSKLGRENSISRHVTERLEWLQRFALGYVQLNRATSTLSGGEGQRLRMATILAGHAQGVLLVLDEPCRGLHPKDAEAVVDVLRASVPAGNSLLVVEHNPVLLLASDHVIAMGPGGGAAGGQVVYQGSPQGYQNQIVSEPRAHRETAPQGKKSARDAMIRVTGLAINNVRGADLAFPVGRLSIVVGPAGSGKSSATLRGVLPSVQAALARSALPLCRRVEVPSGVGFAEGIDQQLPARNSRSTVATVVGLMDELRDHYSSVAADNDLPYPASYFSFNTSDGACPACGGLGVTSLGEDGIGEPCHLCDGMRLRPEVLTVRSHNYSLGDLLSATVERLQTAKHPALSGRANATLALLSLMGLGHIQLGRAIASLSGGERKRIGLVRFQSERVRDRHRGLLVLDEPSTGLHSSDVDRLYSVLRQLSHDHQQTLLVIEHHPAALKHADWIVEFGPGAGPAGGQVLFNGPGEAFINGTSPSASYFRDAAGGKHKTPTQSEELLHEPITLKQEASPENTDVLLRLSQANDMPDDSWVHTGPLVPTAVISHGTPNPDARVWELLDLLPGILVHTDPAKTTGSITAVSSKTELVSYLTTRTCGFLVSASLSGSDAPTLSELRAATATLRRLGYSDALVEKQRLPLAKLPTAVVTTSQLRGCIVLHPDGAKGRELVETSLRWSGGALAVVDGNQIIQWASTRRMNELGQLGARFDDPHVGDVRSPIGQCETCLGKGRLPTYDQKLIVGNSLKSIADPGFFKPHISAALKGALRQEILPSARAFTDELVTDLLVPLAQMDRPTRIAFEYGLRRQIAKKSSDRSDREADWYKWRGLYEYIYRYWSRLPDSSRDALRASYEEAPCPACEGSGVGWQARELFVQGRSLFDWLNRGRIRELVGALDAAAPVALKLVSDCGLGDVRLDERAAALEPRTSVLLQLAQFADKPLRKVILSVRSEANPIPVEIIDALAKQSVLVRVS